MLGGFIPLYLKINYMCKHLCNFLIMQLFPKGCSTPSLGDVFCLANSFADQHVLTLGATCGYF